MIELQKAIKRIIERYIAKMIPITQPAVLGTNYVYVESVRRFNLGDNVVIRNSSSNDAELLTITGINQSNKQLIFDNNFSRNWPVSGGFVQKIVGFSSGNTEFLKAIYIGDPAVIPQLPSITINAKSLSSEWMTLESTKDIYELDITIYIDGLAHYESQYELMHEYVKYIRGSLFRSFYPLVEPYNSTTLSEAASEGDSSIKVSDSDFSSCIRGSWIFLESIDNLVPNRIINDLGDGTMELLRPLSSSFSVGDKVIMPHRHIFNTMAHTVSYGTVNKNTMMKAAVISYRAEEEVLRHVPYIDPLTF